MLANVNVWLVFGFRFMFGFGSGCRLGGVVMGVWLAVLLAHKMTSCRKPMHEILPTWDYPPRILPTRGLGR